MRVQQVEMAIEAALGNRNWFAALVVALSAPDICSKLENPEIKSTKSRYTGWWARYMQHHYRRILPFGPKVFLGPNDAYALRCAVLHEGRDEIADQSAREALLHFTFVEPPSTGSYHCNSVNDGLQLQVDVYCTQVREAVGQWRKDVASRADVVARDAELMTIYSAEGGFALG